MNLPDARREFYELVAKHTPQPDTAPLSTDLAFQATVQTQTPTPKHMADTLVGLTELDTGTFPHGSMLSPTDGNSEGYTEWPFTLPTRPRQTFGGSL